MPVDVVVSGGTREMFLAVQAAGWPWVWVNDGRMRFANSSPDLAHLGSCARKPRRRVPAATRRSARHQRREACSACKRSTGRDRCSLSFAATFGRTPARVFAKPRRTSIRTRATRTLLLPVLYQEIMMLDGEVSLIVGDDSGVTTTLVALADADQDAAGLKSALAEGKARAGQLPGHEWFLLRRHERIWLAVERPRHRSRDHGSRGDSTRSRWPFLHSARRLPQSPGTSARKLRALRRAARVRRPTSPRPKRSSRISCRPAVGSKREVRLIPDASAEGIASSVEVPAGSHATFVGSLRLRVQIDHSWRGDVALALQAPDGTLLPVVDFNADDSANDIDEAFHVFGFGDAMEAIGAWTLIVTDSALGERGHLLGWSLGVNTEAPSARNRKARESRRGR